MPNWASCSLTVEGNPENVRAFLNAAGVMESEAGELSEAKELLGAFVPVPEILTHVHHGSVEIDGQRHTHWIEAGDTRTPITELDEAMLMREHGATNWYDWSTNNWVNQVGH